MWEKYEKNQDEIYADVLSRVKSQLPEISGSDDRFIIPDVESTVEGNRTFFRNYRDIVTTLNRSESHFLKFFTNELGTSGNIEGTRAVFQGKHSRVQLAKLVDRYVKDYVLCPECGKPDTKFIQQNRVELMKCDACGSRSAVRSIS
ncbi:MAG: translation initiation factor IF-2 subunit beta [Candidatus Kariarchaeaceae archaeon]|jgi:translation initiation factor 2 subunit 2